MFGAEICSAVKWGFSRLVHLWFPHLHYPVIKQKPWSFSSSLMTIVAEIHTALLSRALFFILDHQCCIDPHHCCHVHSPNHKEMEMRVGLGFWEI